ncbi:MAG: ATP-binding protein [Geobacteraceae bacterium]|nr:ATP-binding protein [Geobacteraceae bacterium]
MTDFTGNKWGTRQVLALLLLMGAALLGNILAPQLFTGFNYLLGSIAVMLVLRLFGTVWAVVAAVIAALWCKQLFGHFYPVVWLGLEPLFVAYWQKRRPKDTLIMADTVYWLIVGMPVIFILFQLVMKVPLLGTTTAALMYMVIGVTNALIATLLINQFSLERLVWPERQQGAVTIVQFLFQVLMLTIVLPALLVLVLTGREREATVKQKMLDTLEIKSRQVGYEVRQKIFDGTYPVKFNVQERQKLDSVAVTKVLQGIQANQPIQLHLMANKGEVLASTTPEVARLSNYDPLSLGKASQTAQEHVFYRIPPNNPPVPLWQRAGKSIYIRVYPIPKTPVYAIAEVPFAPYQARILRGHRNALIAMLMYLAAGTVLATLVARRIAAPLEQLSKTTTDLPVKLVSEDLVWPSSTISEIRTLVENARQMAHTLSGQFREIAQINTELEGRVEERTRELSDTNRSLRREIDDRITAERQRDHLMQELTIQLRFLQTLMDAIPTPVYFKDTQGQYQGCNQAFGKAFGITREQLIGKTADALYQPRIAALHREKDDQLLAAGGVQQYEVDLMYADRSTHTIIVNKATYYALSGELSGLIGVFVDITERKQAELELDRLMRELEAKNKELESIIYVSSHDLRSPLVNIQGFSRKLAKSCAALNKMLTEIELPLEQRDELLQLLTESMPRSIEFITGSVEKMDSLLSGLLRLSRLGRAAITIENLDMNLLISKIINSLAYQIESTGARITVGQLLPCRGDVVQISQVFTNLLDNAIKYRSAERPLEVHVSSVVCDGAVQYCIRDNGIGIHPDYQNQVWEIFHRINPRDIPGEGLGLTVSRRILDRLNGTIRLESEEGVGSSFFVTLPVQRT